jgi:hypothetical protein
MSAVAPMLAFDADPHRIYDDVELSCLLWRRFFDIAADEPLELVALPPSPKQVPHVAYASSVDDCVRLMREAANIPRATGTYLVPNKIKPAIAARYPRDRWCRADAGRAADHEIDLVRSIYIDCDAERPKGISATDREKAHARALLRIVEDFLVQKLGDDRPLARGDSGNGFSLFIAVEPFVPSAATSSQVEKLLKALARKFEVTGAKIDTSVFNPARLVPAFGTLKTKGESTDDRPHRSTHFSCRPVVRRVPLEVLA